MDAVHAGATAIADAAAAIAGGDAGRQREALRTLEGLQRSSAAWPSAVVVLRASAPPDAALFFAAQTLKQRAVCDATLLPKADALAELWGLLFSGRLWPPSVSRQLSLAFGALAAQTEDTPASEILSKLVAFAAESRKNTTLACSALDALACTAETLSNPLAAIPAFRREELCGATDAVVESLARLICGDAMGSSDALGAVQSDVFSAAVLRAIHAWLRHGRPGDGLAQSPVLLQMLFGAAACAEPHDDAAADALCELALVARGLPGLSAAAVAAVSSGLSLLAPRAVQQLDAMRAECGSGLPLWEVTDAAAVRAVLEVAEAFADALAARDDARTGLSAAADVALRAASVRVPPIVEDALVFWAALADLRLPWTSGAFEALLSALVSTHLPLPAGCASDSAYRDFRHAVGDGVKECARILGADRVLAMLVAAIEENVRSAGLWDAYSSGMAASLPESSVAALEALLFALRVVAAVVDVDASSALLAALRLGAICPPELGASAALVVGCYAEWLSGSLLSSALSMLAAVWGIAPAHCGRALRYIAETVGQAVLSSCGSEFSAAYAAALGVAEKFVSDGPADAMLPSRVAPLANRSAARMAAVDACDAAAHVACCAPSPAESAGAYVAPWRTALSLSDANRVSLALECLTAYVDVLGAADPAGSLPLATEILSILGSAAPGSIGGEVASAGAALVAVAVRRHASLAVQALSVARVLGSDGLRVVRSIAECSSDHAIVREAAAASLSFFVRGPGDASVQLAAISAAVDAGLDFPDLDDAAVRAAIGALDARPTPPGDDDDAAKAEALHLLSRLLRRRVPAALALAPGAAWRTAPHVAPGMHGDIASLLRRHATESSTEAAEAALAESAVAAGAGPDEVRAWTRRLGDALRSTRPRDLREAVEAYALSAQRWSAA